MGTPNYLVFGFGIAILGILVAALLALIGKTIGLFNYQRNNKFLKTAERVFWGAVIWGFGSFFYVIFRALSDLHKL